MTTSPSTVNSPTWQSSTSSTQVGEWEPVIGIEVHVELETKSKMFCGCPVDIGEEPNVRVCPVCLALPGALPVPNRQAIEWITLIGLALNCTIAPTSVFHRKNYFYADLPKNYQISQFDIPVASDGLLEVWTDDGPIRVGIERAHMEEDTGKSIHGGQGGRIESATFTKLDFNRSGVPLVEIVSRPDIHNAAHARAYAQQLRSLILELGVSDCQLEWGSFRFDANVSVRPAGSKELGTKVEVKNMNSFRSLEGAVNFEISRQTKLLQDGDTDTLIQETRHWDEERSVTKSMRTKEGSSDYRYFTEPDLVPIVIDAPMLEKIRALLPELPAQLRSQYAEDGLDSHQAEVLLGAEPGFRRLYRETVSAGADPMTAANWVTGEVTALSRRLEQPLDSLKLSGESLAELLNMIAANEISTSAAKAVLEEMVHSEETAREVAERLDLLMIGDDSVLAEKVEEVLAAQTDAVQKFIGGEKKIVGFLVGQVLRATGGKADPAKVNQLLTSALQTRKAEIDSDDDNN